MGCVDRHACIRNWNSRCVKRWASASRIDVGGYDKTVTGDSMFGKILKGVVLVAALFCFTNTAHGQVVQPPPCPAGTSSVQSLQTTNNTNGQTLQNACVANNGTLTLPGVTSGSSITPVATLPTTCTAGTSGLVSLTGSITVGQPPIIYGAGTVFYCDSTNH